MSRTPTRQDDRTTERERERPSFLHFLFFAHVAIWHFAGIAHCGSKFTLAFLIKIAYRCDQPITVVININCLQYEDTSRIRVDRASMYTFGVET